MVCIYGYGMAVECSVWIKILVEVWGIDTARAEWGNVFI